jgi:hypothetical protein
VNAELTQLATHLFQAPVLAVVHGAVKVVPMHNVDGYDYLISSLTFVRSDMYSAIEGLNLVT